MNKEQLHNALELRLRMIEEFIGPELFSELSIPSEMLDFLLVLVPGASKHGVNCWLLEDPEKSRMTTACNFPSIMRHVAENYGGHKLDKQTGLPVLEHAAIRCIMESTRQKLGLKI